MASRKDTAEERRFLVRSIANTAEELAFRTRRRLEVLADLEPTADELEAVQDLHADLAYLVFRVDREIVKQRNRARGAS